MSNRRKARRRPERGPTPASIVQPPVVAIADLCLRSGATGFEIGYMHDDVPSTEAGWYASVRYRGARLICDDQPSPMHAADGLAHRLLDGGTCTHCGERTTTTQTEFGTWISAAPAGERCRWYRDGDNWKRGCE